MTRSDSTISYSLAYSNSTGVYIRLKHMYSVISVSNLSNDGLTTSQYLKKIDPIVANHSAIFPFFGGENREFRDWFLAVVKNSSNPKKTDFQIQCVVPRTDICTVHFGKIVVTDASTKIGNFDGCVQRPSR